MKNSKAGKRLRKTKIIPQRQFTRFKQTLNVRLTQLDDDLYNLLQGYTFLYRALVNMAADGSEPESWLTGAMVAQRWLQQSGRNLTEKLQQTRQWIDQ